MFSTNGVKSIHVINKPNRVGKLCEFKQHEIELPSHLFVGSVNMPYFRLGSLANSSCDTLTINLKPVADFRYEIDSSNSLKLNFNNLSYFNPHQYKWSFGNSKFSEEKSPDAVTYDSPGIYDVCLEVENEYGKDTFCRLVELTDSTTILNSVQLSSRAKIYPNPFSTYLRINMDFDIKCQLMLYSAMGNLVYNNHIFKGENIITFSMLSAGDYFYVIRYEDGVVNTGKLIRI